MTKKTDKEEVVFDADRPEKATPVVAQDLEKLSHNWQPNSPAVDLSYVGAENAVNVIAQEQAAKAAEEGAGPKAYAKVEDKTLSAAEFERRTKLDVSDKDFINPSLDHYKTK